MLHRRCLKKNTRKYRKFIHIFLYRWNYTDLRGKYIANFIIEKLNVYSPSKSYLLASKVIEKTNNNNTLVKFVNDCLRVLWPERVNDEKVLLMLSDAAPYMVKAANNLKSFYSNLIHVTCAAHGIHLIA